jgi:predicted metal-dependent enzyme (double-stranded beta helix superfamily)
MAETRQFFDADTSPERRSVTLPGGQSGRKTRRQHHRRQPMSQTRKKPVMTITRSSVHDLTSLVTDLDLAVRSTPGDDVRTVEAVCSALRPALSSPDLLLPEHRIGDPAGYRSHLLHVAPDGAFSLVALVWLPGQATAIHDHRSWCVVGVYEGAEHETIFRPTASGRLRPSGSAVAYPGDVAGLLPPGDIHRVVNAGDATAISLHVYGADLTLVGSSIRRVYPLELVTTSASVDPCRGR